MSEKIELIVSLTGGQSDGHDVPAFTALDSAHAVSQALMMIVNFAQTGEIRRRNFKDLDTVLNLKVTRPGSYEFVFEFSQFAPYLIEAYGSGLANASWKLVETVFNRATGLLGANEIEEAESDGRINAGDLGALIQAVEPSVRRSHSVVNHGASNVSIFINGDSNIVTLDADSKEYMHESIFNDEMRSQRFLVTSFDGRNRTGRLFDLEQEQAFTFDLLAEADRKSLTVIVDAARAYALRQKGKFDENMEAVCAFTSVDAPDGRQKRLKVTAAAREFDDLNVGMITDLTESTRQIEDNGDDVIE
ncbi:MULTISPECIES: hypothetical protein [Roseobacteraceae]|uniref:DUF7946 domain-containing protein n=1 Tax=Pseudosulfitobacter pseudonitzschiae TaxID=1402135 RepID=A0A221JWQ5_9RHOB|nr:MULTISPECIES: hypothetical protein [Roseobacteraceae]ASM71070.1 hypothetical protein SULPSESMR1_00234 [Pseudosulfitobacter pseudonitzschiae]